MPFFLNAGSPVSSMIPDLFLAQRAAPGPPAVGRFLLLLLGTLFSVGCAQSGHLDVFSAGDDITVQGASSGDLDSQVSNQTIIRNMGTGVASGAAIGALWGLSCGPFLWICSPFGALAGAGAGATAGLVVGAVESLPSGKVQALEESLTAHLVANNPETALVQTLSQRLTPALHIVTGAERSVVLGITGLGLNTYRKEQVMLVMTISIQVQFPDEAGDIMTRTRELAFEGVPTHFESWIDNHDDFVASQFTTALDTLAEELRLILME